MSNLGEEICGDFLKHILKCEFVSYNVTIPGVQGEIDVIGINLEHNAIYVCEVAIHTSGLTYVTEKRPDDYNRFVAKFDKDIAYAKKYFPKFSIKPMIWSPVVKSSGPTAKYNTLAELARVVDYIKIKYKLILELVINEKFRDNILKLKIHTDTDTSEFKSNAMRMFQIERSLEKNIKMIEARAIKQVKSPSSKIEATKFIKIK